MSAFEYGEDFVTPTDHSLEGFAKPRAMSPALASLFYPAPEFPRYMGITIGSYIMIAHFLGKYLREHNLRIDRNTFTLDAALASVGDALGWREGDKKSYAEIISLGKLALPLDVPSLPADITYAIKRGNIMVSLEREEIRKSRRKH